MLYRVKTPIFPAASPFLFLKRERLKGSDTFPSDLLFLPQSLRLLLKTHLYPPNVCCDQKPSGGTRKQKVGTSHSRYGNVISFTGGMSVKAPWPGGNWIGYDGFCTLSKYILQYSTMSQYTKIQPSKKTGNRTKTRNLPNYFILEAINFFSKDWQIWSWKKLDFETITSRKGTVLTTCKGRAGRSVMSVFPSLDNFPSIVVRFEGQL